MKIIKRGVIPKEEREFCCNYCGCVFECKKGEYEFHDSQKEGSWLETNCPTCGHRVTRDDR